MGTRKGVTQAQHQFSRIPSVQGERSTFDRSNGCKTTFQGGKLIPIFVDEVLPGDTFNLNMTMFARIGTLLFPIMDNVYLDVFFFFIPNRLVWDNWEKFMGAQDNPGDSVSFLVPTMAQGPTGAATLTLSDYLAIPVEVNDLVHNNLVHRGYNLVWNEWFRDENLQDSVVVDTDDGPDTESDYRSVLNRGKRHDYFTSCLPFPQKGVAVTLPLGSSAIVTMDSPQKIDAAPKGSPITWDVGSGTAVGLESQASGIGANWNPGSLGVSPDASFNDPQLERI